MRISCIIPAFNEEKLIGACLDSIIRNSRGRFCEIIVIDNASHDRTSEIAQARRGVKVIREERKGLSFARECGRAAANGDFIAYIDADSRMPEGWIDNLDLAFRQHREAVCISGPPTYFDVTFLQKLFLRILWWTAAPLTYRLVGYMVYGAHFVVKKEAIDEIGGFDCNIEFFGEDTDFARRLKATGEVIFCMRFRIVTSARRFKAHGFLNTSLTYGFNYVWPVLFKRSFSTTYADVR
jgi:glycosyltransferase involved in cell wall biosynthesis